MADHEGGYEGETWNQGEGEQPFFAKLGKSPWEERHASLIYWVTGAVGVCVLLVVALKFGDTILKSFFNTL